MEMPVAPPVTLQLEREIPSGPVTVICAPGSSLPATVSFLEMSTTVGASSIVTTAFPVAAEDVTELPVMLPSSPTVNSISVAVTNPAGAVTSCIVYVPAGRPSIVVGVLPLTKEIVLPDLDMLVPPPDTTQPVRSLPLGPVIVICAPGSSLPATVSFLEISTVPVTGTNISSTMVTTALLPLEATVILLPERT